MSFELPKQANSTSEHAYLDKSTRLRLRAAQSSAVNAREIKSSKASAELKAQRNAQKKNELSSGGIDYHKHMDWLAE